MGDRQLSLVICAAGQVVGAMAHLVEGLNPLQGFVFWAPCMGKQMGRAMQKFFDAEKPNERKPKIRLLQPGQATGTFGQ